MVKWWPLSTGTIGLDELGGPFHLAVSELLLLSGHYCFIINRLYIFFKDMTQEALNIPPLVL